ncbi:hypothetical protein O4J56_16930 [Nocardiopsis sp. RSe5-2]|uniref:Chromosome segregation ATPase n=1 Tax=Nocardiopsis endophytica TaxID=3018445 RepID=A0ABT4U5U2_9ACTN|nr:hypothetical protein [Nocardiopsis endophytica]MDA2812328.1 hypothetical protein [Nocardiopsis endophytica]
MTGTGWRLERTYMAGAGFPESRLEGLDLTWSDPLETTGHAALWADNGTGKTTVTALRYALYLPNIRDFIRGESDRSLAKLVRSGNVCHVIEQATRVVQGEQQRLVVGMVADWPDGGTQDLENPSRLTRAFYGWLTGPEGPTIDDLPLQTEAGRWATRAQFTAGVRNMLPPGGAVPPYAPSERQREWQRWLADADVDIEQIRFQAVMNASEGGVDRVMRFGDSDAFVRWLLGATMSTATVDQISQSIDRLRANADARPSWEDELRLWEQITDPLLNLAIRHEAAEGARSRVETAKSDAVALVADADATLEELAEQKAEADRRFADHEQLRRDAATDLRRAQAHRLRMRLRADELRAHAAEDVAEERRRRLDEVARTAAAWESVEDVLTAREARNGLAALEARRDAAARSIEQLAQAEERHRRHLARLLTERRDEASRELDVAKEGKRQAEAEAADAEEQVRTRRTDYGAANQRLQTLRERMDGAEAVLAAAATEGLLPEGADPAEADARLDERIGEARATRDDTERRLTDSAAEAAGLEREKDDAQRRAEAAKGDARRAEDEAEAVSRRVGALAEDERLLDALGTGIDLWADRAALTEALRQRAARADVEAAGARQAMEAAQRTIESVGADGLLPPARTVEAAVALCREAEVTAWPGWRWLADTMPTGEAEAFARARPDIASGVVVARPDHVGRAVDALGGLHLDTALWVGSVTDPQEVESALRAEGDDGAYGHVLLPAPGTFDRDEARRMVASAKEEHRLAREARSSAEERAQGARDLSAELRGFWSDLPGDPRPELARKAGDAWENRRGHERRARAAAEAAEALTVQRGELQEKWHSANALAESLAETRRRLAPAIEAARVRAEAASALPGVREEVTALERAIRDLERRRPELDEALRAARETVNLWTVRREDAMEALRRDGLTPVVEGPVPEDAEEVLRARLEAAQDALTGAEIPQHLNEDIERLRRTLSEARSRLDADPERTSLAEGFADGEGARHPVALAASVRRAQERLGEERTVFAKAQAEADHLRQEYRRRAAESGDRTSPDVDRFPAAASVQDPDEADRTARLLDDLARSLTELHRGEEQKAEEQRGRGQEIVRQIENVTMAIRPLRRMAVPELTGSAAADIDRLVEQANRADERHREATEESERAEQGRRRVIDVIRAHANGPLARKVEDRGDQRIIELVHRLRSDQRLYIEAESLAGQLEQRAATLRDDLEHHNEHVRMCAAMLHLKADGALVTLRSYQNRSRLPDGLGEWSERNFVQIAHEPAPSDDSVAIDRVARVVHAQLAPGAGRTDAQTMLFAATRALVDAPFRVRILKPHTDMALDRVDVTDLKNFSGGQRVTAGVLLYAVMTRVRDADEGTSIGWLWLDNPFGQASADQFVRTMRLAADRLGLQLVFTAAPKDKGALSMFDRITVLTRRLRPSSREKVVVVDEKEHELVNAEMVQRDVMAVLGE